MSSEGGLVVPAAAARVRPTTRRSYSTGWWGMAVLIATEAMVFVILLATYFFLQASAKEWPLGGIEPPELTRAIPFSFVLWGSSIPVGWAEASLRRGDVDRFKIGTAIGFAMGAAFIVNTMIEFSELGYGWRDNAYASAFYVIVGLHAAHVVVGLLMSLVVQAKAWTGRYGGGGHVSADVFSLYWHFVDAVWLFVFPSLFLLPHLD